MIKDINNNIWINPLSFFICSGCATLLKLSGMRNQIVLIFCLLVFIACTPSQRITKTQTTSISHLKFLGEYDVPTGKQFKGTTIGGLSGIDHDEKRDVYYLISDDR